MTMTPTEIVCVICVTGLEVRHISAMLFLVNSSLTLGLILSDSAVELQQEILRHLLLAVSPQTSRQLRFSPRVRKLWDAPHALELHGDSAEAWRFCIDVQEFQIGILATHSRIHFANISVLQMTLYEEVELVIEFRAVLGLLQIQDLRLFCGNSPTFLGGALRTWAPSLQGLTILRILFDRSSEQVSRVFFSLSLDFGNLKGSSYYLFRNRIPIRGSVNHGRIPLLFSQSFALCGLTHRSRFRTAWNVPYPETVAIVWTCTRSCRP